MLGLRRKRCGLRADAWSGAGFSVGTPSSPSVVPAAVSSPTPHEIRRQMSFGCNSFRTAEQLAVGTLKASATVVFS